MVGVIENPRTENDGATLSNQCSWSHDRQQQQLQALSCLTWLSADETSLSSKACYKKKGKEENTMYHTRKGKNVFGATGNNHRCSMILIPAFPTGCQEPRRLLANKDTNKISNPYNCHRIEIIFYEPLLFTKPCYYCKSTMLHHP